LRSLTDGFDGWDEMSIEPDCFTDAGDSVVVPNVARLRGRDGIAVSARSTLVITVRGRKVSRICLYQNTQEALEAAGLAG
jgi:ketosteroid isomerase-like protein